MVLCVHSEVKAKELPVLTISSGPTNSMRGAAFLSGVQDAVVIDIGGTTTDVGVIKSGFPREASGYSKVLQIYTTVCSVNHTNHLKIST